MSLNVPVKNRVEDGIFGYKGGGKKVKYTTLQCFG